MTGMGDVISPAGSQGEDAMGDRSVSVVIPTFNRLSLLGRALASVFTQTVTVGEVIVVDDGSTDGTIESLVELTDERLKLLRVPQSQGAAHARNVGLDASRSRFVAFLDSDDEWLPTYVERMLSFFDRSPSPIAVCSSQVIREPSREDWVAGPDWQDDAFDRLLSSRSQICIAIVADRSSIADVRFDESLPAMQDRDFVIALSKRGRVICSRDALYVAHADAVDRISDPATQTRAWLMLIEKYKADLEQRPSSLANNYYRLARLQRRAGDLDGVRGSLLKASRADPTDRRLRALARVAGVGPRSATIGLDWFVRLALLKKSIRSRASRAGRPKEDADA